MATIATDASTRKTSALRRRSARIGWSFILPNFIGFGLITLLPVIVLIYMSFTEWSAFGSPEFIGVDNFRRLVDDRSFRTALRNTFYYSIVHVPATLFVSLGLALLLNNRLRAVTFFRTVTFFPYITSIVAIAAVWNQLFSADGVLNQLLSLVGIEMEKGWTANSSLAMPAVILVSIWRDAGYFMLLYLAGLQTIPRTLYEAAYTDGATAIQRFRHVTWPGLRPTTFFVTVMLTIGSLKVFDLVLLLTNGGPGQATFVLSQFIYTRGIVEFQYGYASAAAIVLFVLSLGVTVTQFLVNRRWQS